MPGLLDNCPLADIYKNCYFYRSFLEILFQIQACMRPAGAVGVFTPCGHHVRSILYIYSVQYVPAHAVHNLTYERMWLHVYRTRTHVWTILPPSSKLIFLARINTFHVYHVPPFCYIQSKSPLLSIIHDLDATHSWFFFRSRTLN